MQKSTLYFDACGTIQIVTALDVEIKATLFRTRIALCYKKHVIKAALRTGPEAFPPQVCLP